MACDNCSKEPYAEKLCKDCFVEQIEKRIKRNIKAHAPVQRGETLLVENELCRIILLDIIQGLPVTILSLATNVHQKGRKVLCWTLDDEIHYFLTQFFANEEYNALGHKDAIKLFISIRDNELELLAKAKGLLYTTKPKDKIHELIDNLEQKHPETKFSLAKTMEELKKILTLDEKHK